MIIDSTKHPERNIYYIGAILIETMRNEKKVKEFDLISLFEKFNKKAKTKISFDYFLLSLDWLFMLEIIDLNTNGNIIYVS